MTSSMDSAIETAIENVGGMGLFQVLLILIVTGSKFAFACGMLLMTFGGKIPQWWCVDEEFVSMLNMTGNQTHSDDNLQRCDYNLTEITECSTVEYSGDMTTIVDLYGLICDREQLAGVINSIQLAGALIGGLVTGQIAELFGRKKTFFGLIFLHAVFCALSIIEIDWKFFAAVRFLIGFTAGGVLAVDFSIPVEFMSIKWRSAIAALPSWGLGSLFFALIAYLLHDWKYLTFATIGVTIPFLFGWFIVPESMRWLITKGRIDEARKSFEKIARINGKTNADLSMLDDLKKQHLTHDSDERKYSYLDLIRTWQMARITLPAVFVWFSMGLGYYGIAFGVAKLSGDIYLNLTLSALVDIPQNFIVIFMANTLGRRKTTLAAFALTALSALAVVPVAYLVEEDMKGRITNGLAMTCKFAVGCGWVAFKLHTAELFPTVVRTLSSGVCGGAARVGAVIAPQLVYLTQLEGSLMYLVIGVLGVMSTIVSQMVEETKGVVLPDVIITVDDKKASNYELEKRGEINAAYTSVPAISTLSQL